MREKYCWLTEKVRLIRQANVVSKKKSKKHLSNGLAIELCNFVSLPNRGEGLTYMLSHSALGIASLVRKSSPLRVVARLPLLPPPDFLFCQVINVKPLKIISFQLFYIYLGLDKLHHLSNELCKTVGMLL